MNSFRVCLAVLALTVAWVTAAPANATDTSSMPFLGERSRDGVIRTQLAKEIRQFPAGEVDALLEIIHLCELNRSTLGRKRLYDVWDKRCKNAEGIWNAKFRKPNDRRMIDAQMRLYFDRKLSLTRSSSGYLARKETIALKTKRREDIKKDVREALRLRKEVFTKSGRILKFFFALKELFAEAQP